MSEDAGEPRVTDTEAPDLPCPKCGSSRTEMVWCNAEVQPATSREGKGSEL